MSTSRWRRRFSAAVRSSENVVQHHGVESVIATLAESMIWRDLVAASGTPNKRSTAWRTRFQLSSQRSESVPFALEPVIQKVPSSVSGPERMRTFIGSSTGLPASLRTGKPTASLLLPAGFGAAFFAGTSFYNTSIQGARAMTRMDARIGH